MPSCIGIIDDDEQVRFAVRILLEVSGFDIDVFASAEDFLERARFDRYACVVVDFRLPGLSGLELLSTLKNQQISIPAIVSSGFMSEQDESDFAAAGAAAILHKPVEGKFLVETVRRIAANAKSPQRPSSDEAA